MTFRIMQDELIVKKSELQEIRRTFPGALIEIIDSNDIPPPSREVIDHLPGKKYIKPNVTDTYLIKVMYPYKDRGVRDRKVAKALGRTDISDLSFSSESTIDLLAFAEDLKDHGLAVSPNRVLQLNFASQEHPVNNYVWSDPWFTINAHFTSSKDFWWLNQMTTKVSNSSPSANDGAWDLHVPGDVNTKIDGTGVSVAIIDVGFSPNNYEMTGYNPLTQYRSQFRQQALSQNDFVENDYNVSAGYACPTYATLYGTCIHGFYTSSIAAGARGNNYGFAGVAPAANILLFKVDDVNDRGEIDEFKAARAVDTAQGWGAKVVNMSFATPYFTYSAYASSTNGDIGLVNAIKSAAANGVVFVGSAGNEGHEIPDDGMKSGQWPTTWSGYKSMPASIREVISVGAIALASPTSLKISSYSNYGSGVDIYAPGGDTSGGYWSYVGGGYSVNDSCYVNNSYCAYTGNNAPTFTGTSAAAPIVTGAIALMKQVNPNLTTSQIRSLLQQNSTPVTTTRGTIKMLNVRAALIASGGVQ